MEVDIQPRRPQNRGNDEPCPEPMRVNKKRKQSNMDICEEAGKHSKLTPLDQSVGASGEGLPWRNLQLILSLQDKNNNLVKKVDLAFDYVKSSNVGKMDGISRSSQVMDTSRTIDFLNNWVQSVLISSEKKMRLEENRPEFGTSGSIFDLRCWKILHFCLEESKNLHVSLTCSKDFLRVIHSVAMDASSCVSNVSLCCDGTLSAERLQFYDVVLDCISLVFSFHGGVANENLDLWILLMDKVLELILKIVTDQLDGSKLGNFVLQLSFYLFEPFARFLRVHPTRKNGFHSFIDKLLDPLLQLLHVLHSGSWGSNSGWRTNLSKLVEEVLAQGLFHPTHIDGFLSLQSTVRYRNSSDETLKEEKLVNKSYHRHLFDKVEKIVAKKNELALIGLGELLHLFVSCVTKHKGASFSGGGSRQLDVSSTSHVPNNPSHNGKVTSKMSPVCHSMDADLRKAIFDYFVQILEYLLADLNNYLQSDWEVVSRIFNVSSTLKSINSLLASFICDNLYLRTEDTTEGASRNFLRSIYTMIMSFSVKLAHQKPSFFGSAENSCRELLISVRKELIVAVHHLLNIEYEVVGDNLESLWTMIFSSLACCSSSKDVLTQPLLSEILSLGCRLIDLYSELRQVDSSIFALFRAVRQSLSFVGDNEACNQAGSCSSHSNSLSMLFCPLEFRLSLSNAIKAIPEGQASACIRQLTSDIMESLQWMNFGHQLDGLNDSLQFHLRAELLGKVFCEAYIIILESITVTYGNSYLVGVSLKNLIEMIRPSLSGLVSLQPDSSREFSVLVDGRTLSKSTECDNGPMCWILVVFFRLLLSCRSLFQQAINLMAPDARNKMSGVIGVTVHSGWDWMEMTDSACKGFFSWILEPSATLLNVLHSVSDICIQDSFVLCPPLVYVLNQMAHQRLDDLNKMIKPYNYMLLWNQSRVQTKLKVGANMSSYHKRIRGWQKFGNRAVAYSALYHNSFILRHRRLRKVARGIYRQRESYIRARGAMEMRKEATGLTKFMIGFLSRITKDQISAPSSNNGINDTLIQGRHNNDAINFAIGSLDEKSLPSTLWWSICRNVNIWSSHASKKDLKNFLTLLIQASISRINDHDGHFSLHNMIKPGHMKKVHAHQIALEFLSNTISYEQRFVGRYMASRFCRILQKSVLSLFATSGVDLSKSCDWDEVMSAFESSSDVQSCTLPWVKPNMVSAESCNEQINVKFAKCQYLLTLLMRMPEEYLSFKSSSLYITSILNLERFLVGSLLGWHSSSCSDNPYQVFRLFVSCRKVLQRLTVASTKENVNDSQYPPTSELPGSSFPLPWLLKSLLVVIGLPNAFPEDIAFEAKFAVLGLLNHTSNVLLIASKDPFERAFSSLVSARKLHEERKNLDPGTEESDLSECNLQLDTEENLDAWRSVWSLAESLEKRLRKSLTTFRDSSIDKKVGCLARFQNWNELSSIIACLQGLLWGLASSLGDTDAVNSNFRLKFSSYNAEQMTRIKSCVDTFVDFTTFFLKALFFEDDPTLYVSACGGDALEARVSSSDQHDGFDASNEGHPTGKMAVSGIKGDPVKCNRKRKSYRANTYVDTFLAAVQHEKPLKKSLLMQVFRGENAGAALFFRQLFIACSAILRLNLQIDLTSRSWSLFPLVVDISQFLLLEFSRSEMLDQFALFWLDGVVKFLEELGCCFTQFDPLLSRDFYIKLIGIHLRAIGKCISLQGKEAKLASQETGSRAKNLTYKVQSCSSSGTSRLGEFKERLRMSLRTYIKKSSELHLLSAIQAVERALVGVQEGLMTNYEIVCGSSNGGEVSSVVAAGIDVLNLILEFVRGPKRLNMIKRHIQSLVACLFNIILHLQGPNILYGYLDSSKAYEGPDSGSVILMCIKMLTNISSKPSLFQMDTCHIVQSLRVPGALFQYFLQLQISEVKDASVINTIHTAIDREFSVELYAACCFMLSTALKHHKSETRQCIALLEDSVGVLLDCLEIVNTDHVSGREFFAWEVQEAVKCANSLRRVYEEVRHQKDVFGKFSFQLLSRYIWVYCGFGPARSGIIREVDEALKPGIYALIDTCSADDLQLLHTTFGEGPCRSTLASLQHDYKINFRFEGKV